MKHIYEIALQDRTKVASCSLLNTIGKTCVFEKVGLITVP